MAKTSLTLTIRAEGVKETLRAVNKLGRDANVELRKASLELSNEIATATRGAAQSHGAQAALLSTTIRAAKDRVPSVVAGGSKKLGRYRVPAHRLLFASEFGMNSRSGWYERARYSWSVGRQYFPHAGTRGYWFFPTVEAMMSRIIARWNQAADDVVRKFGGS